MLAGIFAVVSLLHESLVRLLEERPEVLRTLLRQRVAIPIRGNFRTTSLERRVDGALFVETEDGPVLALVLEVQIERDALQRLAWAWYTVTYAAGHRCPAALVVVAPDPDVAAWAAAPIDLGFGSRVVPIVLGPKEIPRVVNADIQRLKKMSCGFRNRERF